MEPGLVSTLELNLPKSEWEVKKQSLTPSIWFAQKFPEAAQRFGCPILEVRQSSCDGFSRVTPLSINTDFFAASLGGDSGLGHSVIYYEAEMQFYYYEPIPKLYKPTTSEKLQNYYRAMMLRCAEEMGGEVDKLNLFGEFRSDKTAKAVVNRAKSVLAASPDFFSATSPHQRVRGPELHERLMRVLCETMLERREGACLTVTQAYRFFCSLAQQRQIGTIKRSMFKATMQDLMREQFGVALRRDIPDEHGKQQEAWRGIRLIEAESKAA